MPHACDECGEEVSAEYHRVFSDNNGYLDGCIECGNTYGQHGREL